MASLIIIDFDRLPFTGLIVFREAMIAMKPQNKGIWPLLHAT